MDINRSGYYKWLQRKERPNRYEEKRIILTNYIKLWHQKHPSYGYHDIATMIRQYDKPSFYYSDHLIHLCCKVEGIKSKVKHYRYKKPGHENISYPNRIKNNWNAKRPLEIIVSDMTVLRNKGINYEWTYFLDTFNNEIISSHLSSKRGDIKPYYQCLDDLLKLIDIKKETAPLILHTDQGTVYSSRAYQKAHSDYNIIRSMSRAGTPTDNPIIESLNGWIKAEMACDFRYWTLDHFPQFMKWYVQYFNTQRPAYSLNYKTPIQYKSDLGF